MDDYYVYSERGWWGRSSTFTSDLEQAFPFTRDQAIKFCRKRMNKELGSMGFVPVYKGDVDEVLR